MTDVTTRVGTRRREQTRARLLDAAHEVFAEVGMDAASVEMICERAGFTRGAFYSNFESKDELFLALVTHLADTQIAQVEERVRGLDPGEQGQPADLVQRVVGASLVETLEPQLVSEIRTQALRDPRLAEAYLAWQSVMCSRVEDIVRSVTVSFGLQLRLPTREVAQLLLDLSEDTCTRAALERRPAVEVAALLNQRLERLVGVLVVATA